MVRYARVVTAAAAAVALVAAGSSTAWAQPTAPTGTSPPRTAAMVAGAGHFVIVDAQAQNGPEGPPTGCLDPETELPPQVPARPRYPILAGGYVVAGGLRP